MTGTITQMAGQAKNEELLRHAAEARRAAGRGPRRLPAIARRRRRTRPLRPRLLRGREPERAAHRVAQVSGGTVIVSDR